MLDSTQRDDELLGSLHDGMILGINVDPESEHLVLHCSRFEAGPLTLRFSDVEDFVANNMRTGNIISCAERFASFRELRRCEWNWLAQSSDPFHVDPYRKRLEQKHALRPIQGFRIQSSYGCELVILFRGELRIEEG